MNISLKPLLASPIISVLLFLVLLTTFIKFFGTFTEIQLVLNLNVEIKVKKGKMEVITVAGSPGNRGYKDGKGNEALFNSPGYSQKYLIFAAP